jgi:PAS domain S-box-containing protein
VVARERRPGQTERWEAVDDLDRFLVWLALATGGFGAGLVACAAAFSSLNLAAVGAVVVAASPLALAGRRALRMGRRGLAAVLACVPATAATTLGVFALHQVDVVVPVGVIVVLVALPLVRTRMLSLLFAGVLAWIVAMLGLGREVPAPGIPEWFSHALAITALTVSTALAMLLLHNLHRRSTDLVRTARAAETRYRTLVEQLPAVTFVDEVVAGDPYTIHPVYVSPQVESLLGFPAERWFGEVSLWRSILHPEDRDRAIELADRVYAAGEPYSAEYRLIAADGRVVWIQEASVIISGDDAAPAIWQGVMFDVTARHEAEAERNRSIELLRRADAQRRELLADLVSAHEAERKHLASEIHDDPVQKMTAVGLRLGALLRTLSDPEQIAMVEQLQTIVEQSIARLRALMFELRPPALDRGGLVAAVRDLVSEMDGAFPSCRIEDELAREPDEQTRTVAYRIAVEALANVQRHARASLVNVLFAERDGGVYLRVRDDGVGIPSETLSNGRPGHLGLTSIRERAEAAGGWSRIEPGPAGGTTVEAWLPAVEVHADAASTPSA